MLRRVRGIALSAVAVISIAGCSGQGGGGGPAVPPIYGQLQEVGDILRAARKKPSKVSDLAGAKGMFPAGFEKISSGDIVVVWGAGMASEGDAASGTGPTAIIAYEKKAPNEGGYVLRQDGKIEPLTAEQFKTGEKAK